MNRDGRFSFSDNARSENLTATAEEGQSRSLNVPRRVPTRLRVSRREVMCLRGVEEIVESVMDEGGSVVVWCCCKNGNMVRSMLAIKTRMAGV